MSQPSILRIGGLYESEKEWNALSSLAPLKVYKGTTRQEFFRCCESGEFDGVVALYRSNEYLAHTGNMDTELVSKLPATLKFICSNGAGYDSIDVAACTARGIQVSNTPGVVNQSTADTTIFLLLGALRRVHLPYSAVRANQWRGVNQLGHDPENKLLGILGMGGIGREVAARARTLGMKIQYHNRSRLAPELEHQAEYVSFEELLRTSDVLSLNCSLRAETRGIIGREAFAMMKDGVVLVNTARGGLIDEAALVEALDSGKVFSAGLDVFEAEPTISAGLLHHPHAVLLPHIGTATRETQRKMELLTLENVRSAVANGVLVTQVPEQLAVRRS